MPKIRPVPAAAARPLVAAALAVLTACSTTRTPSAGPPAVEVPAAWASTSAGPAATRANRLPFDDPQLRGWVRAALEANASIESARAALGQARALRDQAAAGLGPTVSGSASAQRSRSGDNPSTGSYRLGLDASWEADLFGARRAAVAAREADLASAEASLADLQVSIAAETALAGIQWRLARQRLQIAEANLAAQRETLQIAQWRAQAGLGSSLDVEQARAAALQTQAQRDALVASAGQSADALAVLTGRAPATFLAAATPVDGVPKAIAEIAVSIPADVLRQRPDVRAAESAWRAAAARLDAARAQRLPSLRLGGSIGLSALTLGSLTGSGAVVAAALASVDWPAYDGGALDAAVRAQDAALAQAGAGYRAAVLGALKDVEDALVGLRQAQQRREALQAAAESAGLAALLARQRHASGLIDFQTVLETQRSQLNLEDSVASVDGELASGHVRLFKALGGSWADDQAARIEENRP